MSECASGLHADPGVVCGGVERLMSKMTENEAPVLIIVHIGSNMPQPLTINPINKGNLMDGHFSLNLLQLGEN